MQQFSDDLGGSYEMKETFHNASAHTHKIKTSFHIGERYGP
jgi:hypothetical protein